MVSTFKSERGKDVLIDDLQYCYHLNGKSAGGEKLYWNCALRKKNSCAARLHTFSRDQNYSIVKHINEHNHEATKSEVDVRKAMNKLKECATVSNSTASTRDLVANCMHNLDNNARGKVKKLESISRSVRGWKQDPTKLPPTPISRNFSIPIEFQTLENGEQFLQHDSGEQDEQRILIFASADGLADLGRYQNWSVDGTFKIAPNIFYQFFTIHVIIRNHSFARLFALLPSKTQECYMTFFTQVKSLVNLMPSKILCDFEKASINALESIFPDVEVHGCFFHFSQSIYRKIVDLGLQHRYHNEPDFSLKIRCFSALAFLPCSDVIQGFEELSEDEDVPSEFLSYFERAYVGVARGRGATRRRGTPLYPISMWNVRSRVETNMPRTNNAQEGFHSAINRTLPLSRSTVWHLIRTLRKEEALAYTRKLQCENGEPEQKKKKYRKIDEQLAKHVADYNADDVICFLKAIASKLHLF